MDHKHNLKMAKESNNYEDLPEGIVVFRCTTCGAEHFINRKQMQEHVSGKNVNVMTTNHQMYYQTAGGEWQLVFTLIN